MNKKLNKNSSRSNLTVFGALFIFVFISILSTIAMFFGWNYSTPFFINFALILSILSLYFSLDSHLKNNQYNEEVLENQQEILVKLDQLEQNIEMLESNDQSVSNHYSLFTIKRDKK